MRLTNTFVSLFAATILSLAACGGSSSGDDVAGDDTAEPDANVTEAPDAEPGNTSSQGRLIVDCQGDHLLPYGFGRQRRHRLQK